LASGAAHAQVPTRVVAAVHAVKLADIKPGDGVGTATRPGPGDARTALEVHVSKDGVKPPM